MPVLLTLRFAAIFAFVLTPTQQRIVYGHAGGEALTLDYYAGAGVGLHPIAILIDSDGADSLVSAGYDVFSISARAAAQDVQRAIRYVRFHAREWKGDGTKIALIGLSDGGSLSMSVGLRNDSGTMGANDPVDRESARVQAVVAVVGGDADLRTQLDSLIRERQEEAVLAKVSPDGYVNPDLPPFLLINAGKSEMQAALKKAGVRCESIHVDKPQGVPEAAKWLNRVLGYSGPI